LRSKHINVRRFSFSIACVTKTRSPQTTGVEFPRSGSAIFQATFSVVLQVVDSPFSVHVPSPRGPRQPGQFSAIVDDEKATVMTSDQKQRVNWRIAKLPLADLVP